MQSYLSLAASAFLVASSSSALAATVYVAPIGAKQSCTSTGTLNCPYSSVDAAFKSGKVVGGGTVLLMDGRHGALKFNRASFDKPVTIASMNEKKAVIDHATFGTKTRNMTLRNLSVWRPEGGKGGFLVRSYPGSSKITVEGLDIRSRKDATNYMAWDKARWASVVSNAVQMRGSETVIRNNKITGVGRGIVAGRGSLVEGNTIDGFAWDGLRGESYSTFHNNVVKNAFKIDSTHRDGFQSYSPGVVKNLTVSDNTILSWTHKTSSPLRGSMQGIGLFDGYYDDLVINNNTVATDHYHGISVIGTRRAEISDNTVVNISGKVGKAPWLLIDDTKGGAPSSDVLVSGNQAMSLYGSDASQNIVFTANSIITDPSKTLSSISELTGGSRHDSGPVSTIMDPVLEQDGMSNGASFFNAEMSSPDGFFAYSPDLATEPRLSLSNGYVASVPLPHSMILLLTVLVGMAGIFRRKTA
jgi:hypothetical protein